MQHRTKEIGQIWERLALKHYRRQGYRLVRQNWHLGWVEFDLVLTKKDHWCVIEVRGSRNRKFPPIETLSRAKLNRLERGCNHLSLKYDKKIRLEFFEVVGEVSGGVPPQIRTFRIF